MPTKFHVLGGTLFHNPVPDQFLRGGGGRDVEALSVARYTSPMPPSPIRAATSYEPMRVPGVRATRFGSNYRGRETGSGSVTKNADSLERHVPTFRITPYRYQP